MASDDEANSSDSAETNMPDSTAGEDRSEADSLVSSQSVETSQSSQTDSSDRSSLLDRARSFLSSPHIRHEDVLAKRRFLAEKGLDPVEIDLLMREQPPQVPTVPPRTYPQPPPSKLPYMLMGMARLFAWLVGTSAFLAFVYHRFLLPRVTRTALARFSLKQHQIGLLSKLRDSLAELKERRAEAFAVLPPPLSSTEDPKYKDAHNLEALGTPRDSAVAVPEAVLLRCAIGSVLAQEKKPTKEELFSLLEERYPWLQSEEGLPFQSSLWETLNNDERFEETEDGDRRVWTFRQALSKTNVEPSPLTTSLSCLKQSLPSSRSPINRYQHTLDALTDFTGYITTQTYQLSASSLRVPGISTNSTLGPQEEEIRREIRALKGLVLNRRTFASNPASAVRPPVYQDADNVSVST